jgi:hypothetical protein
MPLTSTFSSNEYHGTITSNNEYVGGLIGTAEGNGTLNVSDTLVTGSITGTDGTGGLIGYVGGVVGPVGNYLVGTANVTANVSGANNVGGLIGEVKNVLQVSVNESIFRGSVSGTDFVGGLLGGTDFNSNVTISESDAVGDISGASSVGGLAGQAVETNIDSSSASGTVEASGSKVGGIAGEAFRIDIDHVSFEGSILVGSDEADDSNVGGLFGALAESSIVRSSSSATVHARGKNVGGLSGLSFGVTVSESFAQGTVHGEANVGGIFGYLLPTDSAIVSSITKSYSATDVEASSTVNSRTGGFIGYLIAEVQIEDSFSVGTVAGAGVGVGGLIGQAEDDGLGFSAEIRRVYASGAVFSNSPHTLTVGRLIGSVEADEKDVEVFLSKVVSRDGEDVGHSMDTSRPRVGQILKTPGGWADAALSVVESEVVDGSTAGMRNQSTFGNLAWDFGTVWTMSNTNDPMFNGFPILQWQTVSPGQQTLTVGGGFSAAPQTTITSSGTNLTVNLNKTRVLRLSGSNLNLVTQAAVGGKKATINFGASNSGNLVISKLPLLPSGKYTLTLLTPTGLVAGEIEVVKIAKIRKLRDVQSSGKLNAKVRSVVRKQNLTYASAGTLRCWGVTTSSSASELALAKQKADAACVYAKKRNPELDVVASSRTGNGKPARNQVVKLRYLK